MMIFGAESPYHKCGWLKVNGGCVNPAHAKPGACYGCGGFTDGHHLDGAATPPARSAPKASSGDPR